MGNMDAARDFLDVRDAARALRAIAAARARGEVFNVCSGVGTAVSTVAARLLRHFPGIGVRTDARLLRASDPPRVVGNNARIRDALGWTPRIPLERTLEDAYSAFAEARRLA
jgi:GDP-4-dehydro-6-deoxy-D-mannose reductase